MIKIFFFISFLIFPPTLLDAVPATARNGGVNTTTSFHVGVLLDLGTLLGKMSKVSISMAIDDLYAKQTNFFTNVVLHIKDGKEDVVGAALSEEYKEDEKEVTKSLNMVLWAKRRKITKESRTNQRE
ncbi:hypothetical protein QJS10_CPB19g01556 [Acorus calamus]|uniref:Uncharacterized protein n=1 Tax=Acorus calamus TaxID=4465 RepID=A0AAV9CDX8_ACOCL|nr:hypothetical protein QJS10_CPB19g01556 [Acorus calamus]